MNSRACRVRRRLAAGTLALGVAALLGGCGRQERIISITSEPAGAVVWLNDVELGRTPVETEFTFFGVYDVRLVKAGYAPLLTSREAHAPLHEFPVIDLAATAIPGTRRTRLEWHFELTPVPTPGTNEEQVAAEMGVIERARTFRATAESQPTRAGVSEPIPGGAGSPARE